MRLAILNGIQGFRRQNVKEAQLQRILRFLRLVGHSPGLHKAKIEEISSRVSAYERATSFSGVTPERLFAGPNRVAYASPPVGQEVPIPEVRSTLLTY